jgi:hypothetical protein
VLTFFYAEPAKPRLTDRVGVLQRRHAGEVRGKAVDHQLDLQLADLGDVVVFFLHARLDLRHGVRRRLAIAGFQPYFTTGAGLFRESFGTQHETNVGVNTGGGVKMTLAGPIRLRVDYRVFKLNGAVYSPAHRIYAGLNLKF